MTSAKAMGLDLNPVCYSLESHQRKGRTFSLSFLSLLLELPLQSPSICVPLGNEKLRKVFRVAPRTTQ